MTRYFHIEDGAIEEGPRKLPDGWRNVSGLHLLDAAGLKDKGWLPEVQVGFEPFDARTQIRSSPTFKINADNVTSTYTIRSKTSDEVTADQRTSDLDTLREGSKDLTVVLVELVDYLIAHSTLGMTVDDFSPAVKQSYLDIKALAERVKV